MTAEPMEVGPLARMLIAYAAGRPARVKELVDKTLSTPRRWARRHCSPPSGAIAARAIEAQVLSSSMDTWVQGLADSMARRDYRIQDNSKWDPGSWPSDCLGAGFHEAPRGSLGHWVHINNGAIANYQCVVPSTWNAGPRDARAIPALTKRRLSAPRSPSRISRSKSCARCILSIRAWPAASMWLMRTKRELARVRVM